MRNFYTDPAGHTYEWETPDPSFAPLDPIGVVATLNAVLGLWTLEDAANVAGVSQDDLVREAQSWAAAQNNADV